MKKIVKNSLFCAMLLSFISCDYIEKIEAKSEKINGYETAALNLAKENRALNAQIMKLEYEIQALKSKNSYLSIKLEKSMKKRNRRIASVQPKKNDVVKFEIYKWTPSQLLAMAENEFSRKNYDKSSEYFQAFATNFKGHKSITDEFLFQSGVAAYESGKNYSWAKESLQALINEHPTSKYYRGAKLWLALTNLKQGNEKEFFKTVEEFRNKYRNTKEWNILSVHYEDIVKKYK